MSNKIKRLILYQAPRHQECLKASIKQGFIPSNINYLTPKKTPKTQKYFGKIYNHHYIRQLSYTFGSFQNNRKLVPFASTLTNLKKLCLTINIAGLDKYRKVIKRLFLRKKRMTEIKLILKGSEAKLNFPWKALRFLKDLANLKIMMQFSGLSMLQSLHDFYKHNNDKKRNLLPSLKFQHIFVNLIHPHMERPSFQSILELLTNLEAEAKQCSPYKFSFDLCIISPLKQPEKRSLRSIFREIQSLATLKLDGRFLLETAEKEEEDFMKSLEKAQKLEELSWLLSSKELSQVLDLLPETLLKLETCKKLRLWIRSEIIDSSLDGFLLDLRGISQLQCLSLSFTRSKGVISSSLIILGDSLGKMENLRDLTILCEKKGRDLVFDALSVGYLFEGLGKCEKLESLCLNFYGHFRKIAKREFLKLCNSLQNLKNLKSIDLNLSFNCIVIDEEILEVWNKTMMCISHVVDFTLDFVDYEAPFEAKMFSRFIESFGLLKAVSMLKLTLRFWEIEIDFYDIVERLLYKLKSLDSFSIMLWTSDYRDIVNKFVYDLKKIEEKLSYKTFLKFDIEQDLCELEP